MRAPERPRGLWHWGSDSVSWPRTPGWIAFAAFLAFGALGILVVSSATIALVASVVLADDGSESAGTAHALIRPGMTYWEVNDVTARLPNVRHGCVGAARPTFPPCDSLRVTGTGSWLASHSFRVSLDDKGVVTGLSSPEYDEW
jgi:hypothetical protein